MNHKKFELYKIPNNYQDFLNLVFSRLCDNCKYVPKLKESYLYMCLICNNIVFNKIFWLKVNNYK